MFTQDEASTADIGFTLRSAVLDGLHVTVRNYVCVCVCVYTFVYRAAPPLSYVCVYMLIIFIFVCACENADWTPCSHYFRGSRGEPPPPLSYRRTIQGLVFVVVPLIVPPPPTGHLLLCVVVLSECVCVCVCVCVYLGVYLGMYVVYVRLAASINRPGRVAASRDDGRSRTPPHPSATAGAPAAAPVGSRARGLVRPHPGTHAPAQDPSPG